MKYLFVAAALAALSTPALAGDGYSQTTGWATTLKKDRAAQHYTAGAVAGQVEDAEKGTLSSSMGYYINNSYGNYIHVDQGGEGSVVIDADNDGDVTAGQQNGDGNLTIGQ